MTRKFDEIAELMLSRCTRLRDSGKHEDALVCLVNLTKNMPDMPLGWFFLGQTLAAMEKYSEAIDAFDKAIALDETDWVSISARGFVKLRNNDINGAKSDFARSLSIYPKDVSTLILDCICNIITGDTPSAAQRIKQAIKFNPELTAKLYSSFMKAFAERSDVSKEDKEKLEKANKNLLKSFNELKSAQEKSSKK